MRQDVNFDAITFRDEPVPLGFWDEDYGQLYLLRFDSGWIKVGQSRNAERRIANLKRELQSQFDLSIVDTWVSNRILAESVLDFASSLLEDAESDLIDEARRTSDGSELNPFVRGVGRDRTKSPATEVFRGCRFEYLIAVGDVLAATAASRCAVEFE